MRISPTAKVSFKYLDSAWEADCKRAAAKLVLVCLADHANDGGGCFPSVARIAKRCNLDLATNLDSVKE
ncbi:MAG: helix-turn-helix domain-containing protein [Patescibacteria group bacterium]|nr:helix-turn-helix domain-containing protein [Patescibacteria group bacterium]